MDVSETRKNLFLLPEIQTRFVQLITLYMLCYPSSFPIIFPKNVGMPFSYSQSQPLSKPYSVTFPYPNNTKYPLSHNVPCLVISQIPHLLQVVWSVFLSISCSFQIPTLCTSLGVRNHVSHPYQTKGKIILCVRSLEK